MRRWLSILMLVAVVGCAPEKPVTGKIVIKGSNTFGEELGPRLIEEFRKQQPDVTVEIESKGSGSGFAALLAGECDMAASSRLISEDEQRLAKAHGLTLKDNVIGSYGVAVVVNKDNPVTGLSHEQVRDIFTGAIANWKQVGGPDATIDIFIRDPVSGTYLGFQELAMERKPYATSAKQFKSYPAIVEAVRQDKNAIGYAGMIFSAKAGVKPLNINGVLPAITTVNEGDYPYSRTLRLYTNKASESDAVRAFVRFVQSPAGQNVLRNSGFVRRVEPHFWTTGAW
jgi:phosphate transport system substrate-binding protein